MSEPRNLTKERQLAYLRRMKAQALAQIPATETVEVDVAKRNKAGDPVLDSDGFPTIVRKRQYKRDLVSKEYDARIARFDATGYLQ